MKSDTCPSTALQKRSKTLIVGRGKKAFIVHSLSAWTTLLGDRKPQNAWRALGASTIGIRMIQTAFDLQN